MEKAPLNGEGESEREEHVTRPTEPGRTGGTGRQTGKERNGLLQKIKDMYRERKNGQGIPVRWKIFMYLLVFTFLILFIVWVFQICLLNVFYERTKKLELNAGAEMLRTYIDSEELETLANDYAVDNGICVRLFSVSDGVASEVLSVDVSADCIVHHLTDRTLSKFYSAAVENGGSYLEEHDSLSVSPYYGRWIQDQLVESAETGTSTVLVQVFEKDGVEYVAMLNSQMTPVRAVTRTLGLQFSWIVWLVLAAALLCSYLISRLVARPITRMNESARKLARGDYRANFAGQGYRETRELAKTLNTAAEELSKSDSLQKELIANISHDLRTPLTMIKGYSEVMRDIPGENTPENVQVIIDETTRLSELVSDLLDISKLQAGTRTLDPTRFDLTQTVCEVMLRYEKLTAKDGFCIKFFADDHVDVTADQGMILQVLYNIINNAINHAGDDKLILVRQIVSDGMVRIEVEDHGEGIAEEQLPYIWDRYYKIDRVHRMAMIGTGLGLSIVKGVLEMHHAQYGVNSKVGVGSTFWFALPVEEMHSEEEKKNM